MSENKNTINNMFDEMLEESAKSAASEEKVSEEQQEEVQRTIKETLQNFLKYIRSANFTNKIDNISKKYDIPKHIVKNNFLAGLLGKIADVLNLAIAITYELINNVVEFISAMIKNVVNFAYDVCVKLINLFTLNCGSVAK